MNLIRNDYEYSEALTWESQARWGCTTHIRLGAKIFWRATFAQEGALQVREERGKGEEATHICLEACKARWSERKRWESCYE